MRRDRTVSQTIKCMWDSKCKVKERTSYYATTHREGLRKTSNAKKSGRWTTGHRRKSTWKEQETCRVKYKEMYRWAHRKRAIEWTGNVRETPAGNQRGRCEVAYRGIRIIKRVLRRSILVYVISKTKTPNKTNKNRKKQMLFYQYIKVFLWRDSDLSRINRYNDNKNTNRSTQFSLCLERASINKLFKHSENWFTLLF